MTSPLLLESGEREGGVGHGADTKRLDGNWGVMVLVNMVGRHTQEFVNSEKHNDGYVSR